MVDAEPVDKIVGWTSLELALGTCKHVIKRLIIYNQFPSPTKEWRKVWWSRAEVEAWLNKNELPKVGGTPWIV